MAKKKRAIQNLKTYSKKICSEEKEQRYLNHIRVLLGLGELKNIKRKCLKCEKVFETIHPGGHFNCGCGGYETDNYDY